MAPAAYPAQLLDLAAGYAYLLSLGFLPENITLLGDSSGGHLVLGLTRYLAELDQANPELKVGMPGTIMLVSVSVFCYSVQPAHRHHHHDVAGAGSLSFSTGKGPSD